ncbi:MAG TPA: ABC transporter permease, partial [Candidatus Manganitrophaceae bacterium]|nr:ABC transporter permease [Candidatus Manganitrophaceae bacterium]
MGVLFRWISSRHLFREKRTWLTWVGVALGISVFVAIRIANQSVLDAYRRSVERVAGNTTLEVIGRAGPFDERAIVEIRKEPAVIHAAPIVQSALPVLSPASAQGEILFLVGADLLQEGPFRQYELGGDGPSGGEEAIFNALADPSALLLTEPFAARHQLKVGDEIAVRKGDRPLPFHIVGLLKGKGIGEAQDGNIALTDIASAQWRLEKLGKLDRIDLITDPEVPVNRAIDRLKERLGEEVAVRRPRQRSEQVEKMLFAFQLNLTALSAISLFVGIFLIYTTLLVSVVHRKKEIGILRSLGVTRGRIFLLFSLEGIGIGLTGGLAGVGLGALLARGVIRILAKTVTALYVSVPPSPFSLPPSAFMEGIGIGVAVATLSSFFPALQAGLLKPREAMEGIYASQRPLRPSAFLAAALIVGALSFLLSQLPVRSDFPWPGYLSAALLLVTFSLLVPPAILFFSRSLRPLLSRLPPTWRTAQGHLEQAMKRNA